MAAETRPNGRATRPAGPPAPRAEPGRCGCRPTVSDRGERQRWPVLYAIHHGHAEYTITRIHRGYLCGLPNETVDPAALRQRRP